MRVSKSACLCMAAAAVILMPRAADACRYSVREVGFVDLDRSPYRLIVFRDAKSDEKLLDEVQRSAALRLRGANVELDVVDLGREPDHTASKYLTERERGHLARDSQKEEVPPAFNAVLVSSDDRTLPIDLTSDMSQNDAALESVVFSGARDAIRDQIVEAYCMVVLVEGPDDAENSRARTVVKESVDRMTQGLGSVEKPTEIPPKTLDIPRSAHEEERVLLWALGMEPDHIEHPGIALLFGRARRIGAVLRGDRVEADELVRLMMFVGASCECGLDRSWMQGPMLPMRWDRSAQERLAKHLGFEPESPMVKMEISQILSQSSESAGLRYDDPFMGYREFGGTSEGPGGAVEIPETPVEAGEVSIESPEPVATPAQERMPVATTPPREQSVINEGESVPESTGSPILAVLACVVAANVVILLAYMIRTRRNMP